MNETENRTPVVTVRSAVPQDATALAEIYRVYVEETAITFEYTAPDAAGMERRMRAVQQKYPYLVAQDEHGAVLGYAYVSTFHEREAYDWAVETSIYVRKNLRRCGVGGKLHDALEQALTEMGICNMEACIAVPAAEDDPYLTRDSVRFHARMGYRYVGEFEKVGCKFGRWYNMAYMEKLIGEHGENPAAPKRYGEAEE